MSHSKIANAKGQNLAYFYYQGESDLPTILFCGGFKSDMMGSKAVYLEQHAKLRGQSYVRFDYTGHGLSDGKFEDGTIGLWCADALTIIDKIIKGPVLIAGSSMGGWIALLCALKRPERIAALMGIAAAPDFTTGLFARFSPAQQREFTEQGYLAVPNDYSDEPYIFTQALLDDGAEHSVLNKADKLDINVPVYLVQGQCDSEVPWQTAYKISDHIHGQNIIVELIKDAVHNVSRPQDLIRLNKAIDHLNEAV
jgi:pimeloyl-ACP methyl ester carboxylesterase